MERSLDRKAWTMWGGRLSDLSCGAPMPGLVHYFWECPAAQHLRAEMQQCLPPSAGVLTREHLWLARPPPGQDAPPWLVVALAALTALEHVRRVGVTSLLSRGTRRGPTPDGAGRRAVARFWASVSSFCSLALAPPSWRGMRCAFYKFSTATDGSQGWRATPP